MRSVLENGLHRGSLPVKLWYAGPFFRAERPQQGRYRQPQQVGSRRSESMIRSGRRGHRHRRRGLSQVGTARVPALCVLDRLPDVRPGYREALQEFLAGLPLDEPTAERARLNPLRARRQAP